MTLSPGTTFGPYEIVAAVGEGGMGEVYRARDTRLNRDVAIKTSKAEFSGRFQKEAQAIAALNHSNICTLYDVGPDYLVMEFIEGPTLADRVAQGPVPLDEALAIAGQIAAALEAAHDKHIVHRDLKPANVKLRPDGSVKVLDFGLARSGAGPEADPANSPTLMATQAGVILGTAGYMSPEQARGQAADKRADIWAFGVVLYEMVTGARLFDGVTVSDSLAAILTREPDLTAAQPTLRRLLARCLEKDPRKRLRDISVWADLVDTTHPNAPASRPVGLVAAAAVLAIALTALAVVHFRESRGTESAAMPRFEFSVVPEPGGDLGDPGAQRGAPLISPDGRFVVTGRDVRRLDSQDVLALFDASVGSDRIWSADSKWIAYRRGNDLEKMRIPDGATERIAPAAGPSRGGSWASNGAILLALYLPTRLPLQVLVPGGREFVPAEVPGLDGQEMYQPEFLDGGPDFVFLARAAGGHSAIYLATLDGPKVINAVQLMENETAGHYTPAGGGRLLFVRGNDLYARRLNVRQRTLEGDPELIHKGVVTAPSFALADFSVSTAGILVWRRGTRSGSVLTTFSREGKTLGVSGPVASTYSVRLSPDETRLLTQGELEGPQLLEAGQSGVLSLGAARYPHWSADGSHVLSRQGQLLVEGPPARSGEYRTLAQLPPDVVGCDDVSPDGRLALCRSETVVYAVPLGSGQTAPVRVVDDGTAVLTPRFSPDGRWIAFIERGDDSVFVQPFPGPGPRRQVASQGRWVTWRGDGKEILFVSRADESWVWSIAVSGSGGDLRFGAPQRLFPVRPGPGTVVGLTPLAVSRDGSRIYFSQAVEQPAESRSLQVSTAWLK